MTDLKGKVAVVTGASKGIGAEIARAFAEAGAAVAVNYASSKEGAEKVVGDIKSKGGKAISIKGSVAKADDIKTIFAETKKAFGSVDILVNNAGVYLFQPLEAVTEEEFHRQFNINVLGTILAAQEAAKHFGPEGGSIINVGSVVSLAAFPGSAVYSATKGAVDAVTRVLAAELGPKKIRVNTLAPGLIETEGVQEMGILGTDFEKQAVQQTPLGRVGQPDDVAKAAVFLASDEAGWVTGERLVVAGGAR
ncbi:glucose 1-dehydrogenase [Hyphomicrobium sp.]|uniref:SDR family NAD(P)-dependent oxidoreductase n=1 Tax=Hyphomicrobium sp. TaxID=82 RepID=UPI000FBB54A0|nr:glucose 1-dehydrogenase [Hyphomicrobium sp.]RUP08108.1 MAG: glucose 1-dehydrogenase [Hyphomicrobium sp.]